MSNTGKDSEAFFERHIQSLGKEAYLERRIDLAHVRGLNPGIKNLRFPPQPSDYILTLYKVTHYVEVKSSVNKTSFPFSQIEPEQRAAAKKVTAAGGSYIFFLHALITNSWYCVPAKYILDLINEGKGSVKWEDLERFLGDPLW